MNNIKKNTLFDKIYLIYILLYANIFISPIMAILPFSVWKIITAFTFLLLFVSYSLIHYINKLFFFLLIISIIIFSLPAIFYGAVYPITHNASFILVMLLFCFFKEKYMNSFIKYSTLFICLVILGAYIGFLYALTGASPIFEYNGPEGRHHYFYLTTSVPANAVYGKFIRPGGIYDEPGALSFFICSICLLRVLYKRDDNKTLFMLITGMITISLYHLIIVLLFLLYYIRKYAKKKLTVIYMSIPIVLFSIFMIMFRDVFDLFLLERLKVNSSGRFAGDTRTNLMFTALDKVDRLTFFWGQGGDIYTNLQKYAYFNDNPVTLIARYGIFVTWYYYVFLFIIFIIGIVKYNYFFIFLAICLSFVPHPYPDVISYSFYFVLFFYCALLKAKQKSNNI